MSFLNPEEQLKELKKGIVDLVSETELLQKLQLSFKEKRPLRVKAGFDPSRPDLHLGHAVLINKLRQFQKLGHHVLFLIGDFTARIGDPTGRNETRPILSAEEVKANSETYARQVFRILDKEKTEVCYNASWLDKMTPVEFVGLAGQYTVARMLERDDFKKRFHQHQPIGVHELLYPLIQGYDSVVLRADVELGGTDQYFNLIVGRELQKSYGQPPQSVITVPILEGLDGVQKMSKSFNNYIALEDSPKEMFGKTMKLSDELMLRYYELLGDQRVEEFEKLKEDLQAGRLHPRDCKVNLAKFLVERFHGAQAAQAAEEEFERIFVAKGLPDEMPEVELTPVEGLWICHLLQKAGLVESTSQGRRMVEGGAVELSGQKVTDPSFKLDLKSGEEFVLKAGKKKFAKVRVVKG